MANVLKKVIGKAPVKVAAKVATKSPIDMIEGADILDVNSGDIDFLTGGGGGGRSAAPEVEALKAKANSLKIGQGFSVPKALHIERDVTNSKTGVASTIYTYKGAGTISKMAKRENKRFRTRRDVAGKLYIFRVAPLEVEEVVEE
jgi:hypothetical protein